MIFNRIYYLFFVVVIIRLLLSTLLVDLLHQTYPWPIRGLRFVQNVSMFWMNPIIIFPELSISRIFLWKMWLFHEKLFLPIIYHIVYRNFAWHVFFNGCFCQKKIIEICKNNILVSRKKNLFRFFNLFFPASFIHTKSRIQPWRGGKSKANYGWESSNPEVVEAGSEVSRAFVSIARGAKEVKKNLKKHLHSFWSFFGMPF